MNLRNKYGKTQPLKGARVVGCLHMSVESVLPMAKGNVLTYIGKQDCSDCCPHRDIDCPRRRSHLVQLVIIH